MSGNKKSIPMLLFGRWKTHLTLEHHANDIDDLIEVCQRKEEPYNQVKNNNRCKAEPV